MSILHYQQLLEQLARTSARMQQTKTALSLISLNTLRVAGGWGEAGRERVVGLMTLGKVCAMGVL